MGAALNQMTKHFAKVLWGASFIPGSPISNDLCPFVLSDSDPDTWPSRGRSRDGELQSRETRISLLHHLGIAALWHWPQTYFPRRWKKRANFLWDNSRMVPLSPRSWIIWHIGAGLGVTMDGSAFYSFLLTFTQNVALQLHVLIISASVNNQFSDQILLWL